jgi:hypothetical protein
LFSSSSFASSIRLISRRSIERPLEETLARLNKYSKLLLAYY